MIIFALSIGLVMVFKSEYMRGIYKLYISNVIKRGLWNFA